MQLRKLEQFFASMAAASVAGGRFFIRASIFLAI